MSDSQQQTPRPVALYFDTETTGFALDRPPDDPGQPKLVQLAFILVDADGVERASSSMIVRPNGWTIPKQASDVHGITTLMAERYGVPLQSAVSLFCHHFLQCDLLVAHNIEFDLNVLRFAMCQLGTSKSFAAIEAKPRVCTMAQTIDIVKLPPTPAMKRAGRGPYKSPKMSESYKHFTGKELVGAHDALVDVRACVTVHEHVLRGAA